VVIKKEAASSFPFGLLFLSSFPLQVIGEGRINEEWAIDSPILDNGHALREENL
jgi:hypothetical protein